jgi:hypothetical protein
VIESDVSHRLSIAAHRKRIRQKRYSGARHRLTRKLLVPLVASGRAVCARCHRPIEPGDLWDLGHSDHDPNVHTGPEHARCNRGAPHRNVTSRVW